MNEQSKARGENWFGTEQAMWKALFPAEPRQAGQAQAAHEATPLEEQFNELRWCRRGWNLAFKRFAKALNAAQQDGGRRSWRAFTDQWLAVANDTLIEVHRSDDFAQAQRRMLRSASDRHLQERTMLQRLKDEDVQIATADKEVVFREDKTTLYRYKPTSDKRTIGVPVLVAYGQVGRYTRTRPRSVPATASSTCGRGAFPTRTSSA
jgi:hypothetical protein